jgi:AcrR family transcriptional regulator
MAASATALATAAPIDAEVPTPGRRAVAREAKRVQILEAASTVFNRMGYDGASMNDIAAEAGVSKPTLYVYFDNKEALFGALIAELKSRTPEVATSLAHDNPDVRHALVEFGVRLMHKLMRPDHVALVRTVIGAADKFPQIGRMLFQSGPCFGMETVRAFLDAQEAAGRLTVPDKELAAWQLLDLVQIRWLRMLLFNVAPMPDEATLRRTVEGGVDVFLAAYARR